MRIEKVCVVGGAGFIGCHIVRQLDAAGFQVKVLARRRESAKRLFPLPNVEVVECNVMDDAALLKNLMGMHAVVNLLGILHEDHGATFSAVHAEFPRRLVQACREIGVGRLLQVSALNADIHGPSAYLRSKGEGEAAVRQSGLNWAIFRPSVVFGRGDSFLSLFARLSRLLPVVLLAAPEARFQPVWVEDVAAAVARSLELTETVGQSYDLCGPHTYALRELVAYAAQCVGRAPHIVGLGPALSYWQARLMEMLPGKLLTRDNLLSMQADSVCHCAFPAIFGVTPSPLETVAPEYLSDLTPRHGYLRFRQEAGR